VAELAGNVVPPAEQFAVHDHADAEAVGHRHEHEIASRRRHACLRRPDLRQRARASRVFDLERKPDRRRERLSQVHVAPAQRRRVQHAHRRVLDHAGHDDADAFARVQAAVFLEERADALRQRGRERFGIALGGKSEDAAQRPPEQVREHVVGLAGANVHGHHRPPARIDIEKGRLPPALALAGRAFDDQPGAEEVVDDQADAAAAHAHRAGEVGARNRLVRAHEIQHDLPVDLARRALRGDTEADRVDPSH
jgi:hypothetical protein